MATIVAFGKYFFSVIELALMLRASSALTRCGSSMRSINSGCAKIASSRLPQPLKRSSLNFSSEPRAVEKADVVIVGAGPAGIVHILLVLIG